MNMKKWPLASLLLAVALAFLAPQAPAHAQIGEVVKDAVEDETEKQVEELMRNAVRCAFDDLECIEQAEADGEDVVLTDEDGEVMTDEEGRPITDREDLPPEKRETGGPPAGEASSNFDFEAGERTIFAENFASDNLGDFPRSLEFREGNLEVVEWDGRRWLRVPTESKFAVELGEELPETFTIEFDLYQPNRSNGVWIFTNDESTQHFNRHDHNFFMFGFRRPGTTGVATGSDEIPSSTAKARAMREGVVTARVMVDGSYAKVYVNKRRVANVPNADLPRTGKLWFQVDGDGDDPTFLTDLRIAAGGKDLYDALATEGRVAVQDILFDTNSADIKPSSSDVLGKIASLLQERPELELLIEGHTDDQGGFQHNMELSKERAAAVKTYLVQEHGVASDRLETIGLGPTQPATSNDTEEGRAENRRVELVRIDEEG